VSVTRLERVLVVDDDPGARLALCELLGGAGFSVTTADGGASALRLASEQTPDVILTDLQMPDMSGIELCRALQARDAELPVIILTGFQDMSSAVDGLRAGAVDYLTKPLQLEAVLLSVQRALERRAANVERARLRARNEELYLQAVSALRANEDLLSVICHDLRTPLNVIGLQAEVVATRALSSCLQPELGKAAASILRNAGCMDRLLADLLDTSRLQHGQLRLDYATHSSCDLLDDVFELRPLALSKQIDLHIERSTDRRVTCDRGRLRQVLANLVGNAIKFSPPHTCIRVITQVDDGNIQFAVRDEGPGIEPQALRRIFDRFWQSEPYGRSGAGLGLYIAKGIVERHGGRIWVESQVGAGSTFHFTIPCVPPSSPELTTTHDV
jgi:signal transduction histidine kinase